MASKKGRLLGNGQLDFALLIIRICVGGLMLIQHGVPKMQMLIKGNGHLFKDPMNLMSPIIALLLVLFAEFLCSISLMVGWLTKWATIPLIITMLVIIGGVHWEHGLSKLELPMIYLASYVLLFLLGAGKWSLDYLIYGRK